MLDLAENASIVPHVSSSAKFLQEQGLGFGTDKPSKFYKTDSHGSTTCEAIPEITEAFARQGAATEAQSTLLNFCQQKQISLIKARSF